MKTETLYKLLIGLCEESILLVNNSVARELLETFLNIHNLKIKNGIEIQYILSVLEAQFMADERNYGDGVLSAWNYTFFQLTEGWVHDADGY